MDESEIFVSFKVSFFFVSNLAFTVMAFALLCNIYSNHRQLLVKPSSWLVVYSHVFFQWPLALLSNTCERWLPNPYTLSLLVNGFVFAGIALSYLTFREAASDVYTRLTALDTKKDAPYYNADMIIGLVLIAAILYVYLTVVPFSSTGFYAIFFDPISYSTAREESLKLLEGASIKYLYSIMFSTIVPLTVGLLVERYYISRRSAIQSLSALLLGVAIGLGISITGERTGFLNILIVAAFIYLLRKNFSINMKWAAVVPLLALAPPVLLSIIREDKTSTMDWSMAMEYVQHIFNRALILPFQVGTWYVHYEQVNGPLGLAAFQKLADLYGMTSINGPNLMGLTYGPQYYGGPVLDTISATAGYLFTTYCYIGIVAFPLAILASWILDLSLYAYRIFDDVLLIPCMASINLSTLMFIQSDYTVVLLTHGFLMIIVFSIALSRINGYARSFFLSREAFPPGSTHR